VASYTYELPFGAGKKFLSGKDVFSRYVAGGWSLSGIHTYRLGLPSRPARTFDWLPPETAWLKPNRHFVPMSSPE